MIKAAIYDLDDLMVNSDPLHKEAWDIVLSRYGRSIMEISEEKRTGWIGMRLIDVSKQIHEELKLPITLEQFYADRKKVFMDLVKESLTEMPGLQHSLELFKKNGFRIAIASSGTTEYIGTVLKMFNISEYFETIVSGEDVKVGKPDPEPYLVACRKLGLPPSECVVLEDATKGIQSAKSAGCYCIAVRNTYTLPQDLGKADVALNSLNQVSLEMVRSLGSKKIAR